MSANDKAAAAWNDFVYDNQETEIRDLRVEVEKQRKEIKKLREALHDIASFANKHKEDQTLP